MNALFDARLADCRRIFLRNYVVDANIGIHAHEKNGAQRVALNVDVFVPLSLSTPLKMSPLAPPPTRASMANRSGC